ncbi:MAG TPA: orotidine-5'-phosphate decarboxylase [Kiritimatiellia bacterium]|jgi:orotidine-5'-phosphate decarboxylase|nr:orotidine-5'-phosphate decarboxylase [Kiritimatiellia bacterium]HOM59311.1 orotidine-5'-phosphate decarboxylase [Kiritimatiellia bacterium]HOR97274.1 orotidine-5'-phosphate decarboxylase [Kiritimatiellia bacterium]HPC48891.1 orotidine-5'-phosphate decarboxylase [Kiritimatiellia bacterium]HPK36740.1 orotidine-5'-phosphate decarboxylase [Kiritimatiellia bacterium]
MAELIVALDVASTAEVARTVDLLGDAVSFYKIGLELFSAEGPEVVRAVRKRGKRVFLDLKLHDIPRTVERAVRAGAALGVELMTLHAAGGRAMIRAAKEGARSAGADAPRLLAVTMLTSLDQADLADFGVARSMAEQVEALGRLACESGADGIVCSPQEVARMRTVLGADALVVTPGVRPAGAEIGDQKRVATPAAAVRNGSTHLVVGRPILEASDPCAAARAIVAEMSAAAYECGGV